MFAGANASLIIRQEHRLLACARPADMLSAFPSQRVLDPLGHIIGNLCSAVVSRVRFPEMEKPNVHGPSPSRKAQLALREKLNRPDKPPPLLRTPINSRARKRHR